MTNCHHIRLATKVVLYPYSSPRFEELVKLHELEGLKDVLKLKKPGLWTRGKENPDPIVVIGPLLNRRVADLKDALFSLNTHLSYKALVILEDLNDILIWPTTAIGSQLAHSEFQAG